MKALAILALLTALATAVALGGFYYVASGKEATSPDATITATEQFFSDGSAADRRQLASWLEGGPKAAPNRSVGLTTRLSA